MQSPLFHMFGKDAKVTRVFYQETTTSPEAEAFDIAKYYASVEEALANGETPPAIQAVASQRPLTLRGDVEDNVWERAINVTSIKAAENFVMDLVPVEEIEVVNELADVGCSKIHKDQIPIVLNRKANIIAARSRRGAGNIALVGKNVVDLLRTNIGTHITEGEKIGEWTEIGFINSCITLYTGASIPDDEVFVAYVGSGHTIDGPAGLLVDGDEMRLFTLENIANALGNAEDYVARFRVKLI